MKKTKANPFPHLMKLSPLRLVIIAWLLFGSPFLFSSISLELGNNLPLILSTLFLSGVVAFLSLLKLSNKDSAIYQLCVMLLAALLIALDILFIFVGASGLCCI
jgi:hypothetical protein